MAKSSQSRNAVRRRAYQQKDEERRKSQPRISGNRSATEGDDVAKTLDFIREAAPVRKARRQPPSTQRASNPSPPGVSTQTSALRKEAPQPTEIVRPNTSVRPTVAPTPLALVKPLGKEFAQNSYEACAVPRCNERNQDICTIKGLADCIRQREHREAILHLLSRP